MTKRWPHGSIFLLLAILSLFPIGCRFLSLGDTEEGLIATAPETKGSANVLFKVVDPDQKANIARDGDVPAGTVRASGTGVKVTFRLILVDPGAAANRVTTLVKTVTVSENGTAEASFQGVPAKSVVGEIVIDQGAIGGKNRFHGAGDLSSGDNVLEVSPKGSGHRSDITANVVLAIMQVSELLAIPIPSLVSRIESAGAAAIANPTADTYATVLNAFVTTQVVSDTIGRLTIDTGAKTVHCAGAGVWSKDPTQVWGNTDEAGSGFEPVRILRQGLGGYCYVGWQNAAKTRSAVTRHNISDGSLEASFVLEGFFQPATVLENGHLILGGTQSGLPLIVRWNGTTSGLLTPSGISSFQAVWARQFPGLTANQAVADAGVEYLEIEPGNTSSILCVVRDPQTRFTRQYRVGLDGTTPVALNQTTTFGAWARAGNAEVTVGWDSVAPTGVTYNLYWALTSDLSPASHTGTFTDVTSPYVHTALTNGQTYHYLVTWHDGTTEHAQFEKASARPLTPVVPQGFSKIAAGSTWSIVVKSDGTAWACGMSGSYMGVTGVGATDTKLLELQQVARVSDVMAVSTSKYVYGDHSLFLSRGGTVWSVGRNESGELGQGHTTNTTTPDPVPGLPPIVAVAIGQKFSLALANDGTVWGWGLGTKLQTSGTSSPAQIEGLQDIVAIAAGYDHGLALHRDGTVWGWGSNSSGNFAVTDTADQKVPVKVPGLANVVALDAGVACSVFLRSDGKVLACGHNPSGFLGLPATTTLALSEIPDLTGVSAVSVSEGRFLACKTDGTVWTGGSGGVAQVAGLPSGIVAVSSGGKHSLAMTQDGSVWAWGQGDNGQLGNGTDNWGPLAPARMPFATPTVPPAPTEVKVKGLTGRNILTWNSVSGTFYRIYYSTTGAPTKNSPYVDAPKSPFTHGGLTDGTTYSYAVSRIDAGGESALTTVAQGTPGPHRSIKNGEWWDGTVWSCGIVPTSLDHVIIEHQVTSANVSGGNQQARAITIESAGTLVGSGFGQALIVEENVLNKGTMAANLAVRGNYEHQGAVTMDAWLTFVGPGDHVLSHGADAAAFNFPVSGEAATTTIKAGTDLKFAPTRENPNNPINNLSFPASELATGVLDMGGHSLKISGGGIGLRVGTAIIKNLGGLSCLDNAQIVIPRVENPSSPLRIDSNVNLGHLGVVGDVVVVDGGLLLGATSWGSISILGNLTIETGGSVSHGGYGTELSVSLSGDLHVAGTLTPSGLTFAGTGQQGVSSSGAGKLTGTFSVRDGNTVIKAGSDLHADTCRIVFPEASMGTIDMNGKKLTVSGGTGTVDDVIQRASFEVTAGKVVNLAELNASSTMNFVHGTFESTSPILVTGDLVVSHDLYVKPGIIVQADASLLGKKGRLHVEGSLTNHGLIDDVYNGLHVMIAGDLTQNGTYTPSLTTFTGQATQTLIVASDKVLPGSYVDADPSFGLKAGSALRFENATLDLHPQDTIGTGTLDMAGYGLHLLGGVWNVLGEEDGFIATRAQIVGVSSINVSAVEDHTVNHTRFGDITFEAADPEAGITMNGAFILYKTITMLGNVTLSQGSSLTTGYNLLMKVDGNFTGGGGAYLPNPPGSKSLWVQATGLGSISLP